MTEDEKVKEEIEKLRNGFNEDDPPSGLIIHGYTFDYLLSHISTLEAQLKEKDERIKGLEGGIEKLLMKVNRVTAPHRHGNPVPIIALDDLANCQLEIEEFIKK
jgi:hypothetical protein